MRPVRFLVAIIIVGLAFASTASAQDAQPWAQGVSDDQKTEAQARLEEGNALFLAQKYKEALEKYQAAIAAWDHPAIRFNVVRCLIQLDRPVEASDNLQLALKYGAAPLEEAVYTEALSYQKLLAGQIAEVEVSCSQEGATLTLDGQPFMTCPGTQKRRVAPGQHGLVATKEGFLTKELQVVVVGGTSEKVDVELVPLAKAARVVHRWPTWMPWVVFGSGLAVAGFGTLLQYNAGQDMDAYDSQVQSECAVTGCRLDNLDPNDPSYADDLMRANRLNNMRESAERQSTIAISVLAVGAVGAAVGGVLLFMNRGQTVYEDPAKAGTPTVNVSPTGDGGGIVTLSGRF